MQFTTGQVAQMLGGNVEGDSEALISNVAKIESAGDGDLAFLSNPKYESFLYETNASAVIVNDDFAPSQEVNTNLIRVKDAYLAFTQLLVEYDKLTKPQKSGVEQPSFVSEGTDLPSDIYLGAYAYLGKNCSLGKNVKIYPNVWIDDNCTIAEGSIIYSGAKLYHGTVVGKNCVIHANAVIGADGFGFAPRKDGGYDSIPQIGNVVLEDDVSIGAGTTVDRATMGSTIVRKGAKIDNLVQIAHNVEVGQHTVMAAQSGISGSSKLGDYCMVAGQVGIVGHITVANKTTLAAKCGVSKSVKVEGQTLLGQPAQDFRNERKSMAIYRRLPELNKLLNKVSSALDMREE